MKSLPQKIVILTLFFSLTLTSCETTGINPGIAGALTGVGSGAIARGVGASTTESLLIGAAVGVTTAIIISYSKRKATEREQAAAAARAAQVKKQVRAKSKSAPKNRYVAVPTKKSDTVMLYDTKKDKMVNSSAYELDKTPKKGEVVKFGSINAEYVGT